MNSDSVMQKQFIAITEPDCLNVEQAISAESFCLCFELNDVIANRLHEKACGIYCFMTRYSTEGMIFLFKRSLGVDVCYLYILR